MNRNGVWGAVNNLFANASMRWRGGDMADHAPDGVSAQHTGNPVRAFCAGTAPVPLFAPGDYPMELLLMGGSQGARILPARSSPPSPICRWKSCCAISRVEPSGTRRRTVERGRGFLCRKW